MSEKFVEELLEKLQEYGSRDYDFRIMGVTKLNEGHKTCICASRKSENIGVNLYSDMLVRMYNKHNRNMDLLAEDVIKQLDKNMLGTDFAEYALEQVWNITDYSKVKEQILFRIVNKEANKEILQEYVYVPYLDFAVCFYIAIGNKENTGLLHLTKAIFDMWNVPLDELYQQAMLNTTILRPYEFKNIYDVIEKMVPDGSISKPLDFSGTGSENFSMWVLTNNKKYFGAGVILYDGLMQNIANQIGAEEIVILPSSVHECILIPMTDDVEIYYLKNIVYEVNTFNVEHHERLSGNVYLYSKDRNDITILT